MHYFMSKKDQHQQHTSAHPRFLAPFPSDTYLNTSTHPPATVPYYPHPPHAQLPSTDVLPLHVYINSRQTNPLAPHPSSETQGSASATTTTPTLSPTSLHDKISHNNSTNHLETRPPSICAASNCYSPASLRCTRCKDTQYCSRLCQSSHWRSHKTQCQPPGATQPPDTKCSNPAPPSSTPTGSTTQSPTSCPDRPPCVAPWCHQRATISCSGCLATLYCSATCGHLDSPQHACICPVILSISSSRKWDHLSAEGWEPTHILALTTRFANPPLTASEKFSILFGDNPFICKLAEEARNYTHLSIEHIHQLAVEATPETLLKMSKQLLAVKKKCMAQERANKTKRAPQEANRPPKKIKLPRAHTFRRRPSPLTAPSPSSESKVEPEPQPTSAQATPVISISQQDAPDSPSASTCEGVPSPLVPHTECQPEARLPQDPAPQEWLLVALTHPNTLAKRRKSKPSVNAVKIRACPRHYNLDIIANKLAKQKLLKLACIHCKSLTLNPIPLARCGVG